MIQIHQLDLKKLKRHETELKLIKCLQSPFSLGFNDRYTMKVTFLKCQILMLFSVLECKNVKVDLMLNVKKAT